MVATVGNGYDAVGVNPHRPRHAQLALPNPFAADLQAAAHRQQSLHQRAILPDNSLRRLG